MYRPANYYAARTAAIKEALEEDRAQYSFAASIKPAKVPAPLNAESLINCGEKILVTLGVFFGDRQGEVVEAVRCYNVTSHFYIAKFREGNKTFIIEVVDYHKGEDIYNYALTLIAVI